MHGCRRIAALALASLAAGCGAPKAPETAQNAANAAPAGWFLCETATKFHVASVPDANGAFSLRTFKKGRPTAEKDQALSRGPAGPETALLSGSTQIGSVVTSPTTEASATIPAALTLDGTAETCRAEPSARLFGFSAEHIVLVRRAENGALSLELTGAKGGAPVTIANGAEEIGVRSSTMSFDNGPERWIIYAPTTAPATLSLWKDGARVSTETLLGYVSAPIVYKEGD